MWRLARRRLLRFLRRWSAYSVKDRTVCEIPGGVYVHGLVVQVGTWAPSRLLCVTWPTFNIFEEIGPSCPPIASGLGARRVRERGETEAQS